MNNPTKFMRILLRQQKSEKYLQPTGEWSEERETAREFLSSVLAFLWARERKFRGVEVLMAFENPRWDFVPMTI